MVAPRPHRQLVASLVISHLLAATATAVWAQVCACACAPIVPSFMLEARRHIGDICVTIRRKMEVGRWGAILEYICDAMMLVTWQRVNQDAADAKRAATSSQYALIEPYTSAESGEIENRY